MDQRIDTWPDGTDAPASGNHNLPGALTTHIDRDEEMSQVRRLIGTGRLVTVTGIAGSGKSRLAIETARSLVDRFDDGVRYANLASAVDDVAARELIAAALGVAAAGAGPTTLARSDARSNLEAISDFLADKSVLLVLDGVERVAGSLAPTVEALLRSSPSLRVLMTTRIPFGMAGEMVWHMPLFDEPEEDLSLEMVRQNPGVRLFADRARTAQPGFVFDDHAVRSAARIVRRLDGNPLSIELAAARVNVLDVAELADRLERSFDVLAGADDRLTLDAAIEWGYELLTEDERLLFDRLSVFRADFSVRAAEDVGMSADVPGERVIDLLGSLVDKSMVLARSDARERVYRLGDTMREYGEAKLDERGETTARLRVHAEHYRQVALACAPELRASFRTETLDRLERSHADIMAALEWAIANGEPLLAFDIVRSIYLFWFARRHRHAIETINRVLAMPGDIPDTVRAGAQVGAGMLEIVSGDFERGSQHLASALVVADAADAEDIAAEAHLYVGIMQAQRGELTVARSEFMRAFDAFDSAREWWGVAWVTSFLGTLEYTEGNLERARELVEESLGTFREIDSAFGIGNALAVLGNIARSSGDLARAMRSHREALDLFREVGDRESQAAVLASLAVDEREADRPAEAVGHFAEAIELVRGLGNRSWLAELHYLAGNSAMAAGDLEASDGYFRQAITLARDLDTDQALGAAKLAIEGCAWWAFRSGRIERAVTLFAAHSTLDDIEPERFFEAESGNREDALTQARARLGSQLYQSLWSGGRSMSLGDVISYALSEVEEPVHAAPLGLSLEEIELGERVAAQLSDIGERREVRVAGVRVAGRRRRPSGERAPLERQLRATGKLWLLVFASVLVLWLTLFVWPTTRNWWTARDVTVNQWFTDIRSGALTDVMLAIHALGSAWFFRPLRWAMLVGLIVLKRWRHLFAALFVFAIVEFLVDILANWIARPRPLVVILGDWQGFAHPSAPVASVAATLVVIGYTLIPRHTWRNRWMIVVAVLVTVLAIARIYLGVDHPTDAFVAAMFGVSAPVVIFRWFVPEGVFPVVYKSGRTAHLDVSGPRGEAIRRAVAEQLGLEILEMKPFGLEGSGGSTPLRIKVAGDPDTYLFAKLYATNHLRADRWYKIGRTILVGSLEDEVRFTSVRRLVEYEDYMMLRMKAAGVPSAESYGIVEITPEREYVIVTEFIMDAEEITTAEIDDAVIDDALLMVRRLWDAGLAHRDVKPANVLVRDGKIRLIDTAFGTIRPTPWRQAVDLANMMIILALRTDTDRVYDRALRYFAPEDIAEAFAATRSITIPTQSQSMLRTVLREEQRDVIKRFRELAPPREPITIQRWGTRRIALTLGAASGIALLVLVLIRNLQSGAFV